MRLASFNILHGRSFSEGWRPVEELVDACTSLEADVLGLQEVDRHQPRSGHVDQTAEVAQAMGAAAWRFQPAIIGEPGATWRPAGDDDNDGAGAPGYGVALVSMSPVHAWHVLRLDAAPVRSPVYIPANRRFILLRDEPRVALAAEVTGPSGPMVVATTHLSFAPGWNAFQLRRVTRWLASLGPPCVLLGDLNLPGPFPRWAATAGWRPLGRVGTFPADQPTMQIDHALGFGALPGVSGVAARRLAISDHRALVLDLDH